MNAESLAREKRERTRKEEFFFSRPFAGKTPAVLLIDHAHLEGRDRRRFHELLAISKEVFVSLAIIIAHAADRSSDQIPFRRGVDPDSFISLTKNLHSNLLAGKIQLDVQNTFLSDQIFFLDAYRGYNKRNTAFADVDGLAREEKLFTGSRKVMRILLRGKTHLDRHLKGLSDGSSPFYPRNAESGN